MKTKFILPVGIAVIFGSTVYLVAENIANDDRIVRDAAQPHIIQRTDRDIPTKASQILGREITDTRDHKIGKVKDLAVDLQNGRIVEVIVATGGFLGVDEKYTAVPPAEFRWDPEAKKLIGQFSPEDVRNAPPFDLAHWSENVTPERLRQIYHRYNVTPYFVDESISASASTEVKGAVKLTSASMAAPTEHLGSVERIRGVVGARVENLQEQHLGKVESAIVDLQAGRIVVLVVSTGGFLGMGNEVSAIPPQAFHRDPTENKLILNTTVEALRTAPHYKPDQWPAVANSGRIATVYNAYNIPPYQNAYDADNTAQNVRDRSGDNLTPFDQGTSSSDRAITTRIRREIMARPDLSINARNVKIITVNGHVTLRGPVKNMEEEKTIIEIARNAVALGIPVTNQIQSIGEPPKARPVDSN